MHTDSYHLQLSPSHFSKFASPDSPRKTPSSSHNSYLDFVRQGVQSFGTWRRGSQRGLASSHFFFRFRHVRQPVLERPFVTLFVVTIGVRGCFRGRPRGLLTLTGVASAPSAGRQVEGASFNSFKRSASSSSGSSLGIANISSDSCSQWMSASELLLLIPAMSSDPTYSMLQESTEEVEAEWIMVGVVEGPDEPEADVPRSSRAAAISIPLLIGES